MTYKLVTEPEVVHWSETREFTITDDNWFEYRIRVTESSERTIYWTWTTEAWVEITSPTLLDWLNRGYYDFGVDYSPTGE